MYVYWKKRDIVREKLKEQNAATDYYYMLLGKKECKMD